MLMRQRHAAPGEVLMRRGMLPRHEVPTRWTHADEAGDAAKAGGANKTEAC